MKTKISDGFEPVLSKWTVFEGKPSQKKNLVFKEKDGWER